MAPAHRPTHRSSHHMCRLTPPTSNMNAHHTCFAVHWMWLLYRGCDGRGGARAGPLPQFRQKTCYGPYRPHVLPLQGTSCYGYPSLVAVRTSSDRCTLPCPGDAGQRCGLATRQTALLTVYGLFPAVGV